MLKQLAIFSVLAAGCLHAQSTAATIPFPFEVGGLERPAGTYQFIVSGAILKVQSTDRRIQPISVVTILSEGPRRGPEKGIQFLQYGGICVLSKVWTADGAVRTIMTKQKKELRTDKPIQAAGALAGE